MTAIVFFMVGTLMVVSAVFAPVFRDVRMMSELRDSKQSFTLAEAGVEDAAFRIKRALEVSSTEVLTVGNTSVTTQISDVGDTKEVLAVGDTHNRIRKLESVLVEGTGVAFSYGVQAGKGGFTLQNSARVIGNVYANGTITGASNEIDGDAVSAGPEGLIRGIEVNGSAYAHTIEDSDVQGDAYYADDNLFGTPVGGEAHENSPDQPLVDLPISDEQVEEWKADAEAGGTITSPCPYKIDDDATIGPVKIACDLQIESGPTVTLEGAVWVEGDITVQNSATMRIAASVGDKSIPVIADYPDDPESKGRITLQNNTAFEGSGSDDSYILLLSQNTSAENDGGTDAIKIQNGAEGELLLYAGHGRISLENNISLNEVTAYEIHAQNSAEVIYESGLANSLFTTGPSGGFEIDSWLPAQ